MNRICTSRAAMLLAMLSLCGLSTAPGKAMAEEVTAPQHIRSGTERQASSTMPDALLGVWHSNDAYGRRSCDAYRNAGSSIDTEEESYSLIGSLVITKDLVHAYAEYGEGDYHAVKHVAAIGNRAWRVKVLVSADTMPDEGSFSKKDSMVFMIDSGLLSVKGEARQLQSIWSESRYFRCGDVLARSRED